MVSFVDETELQRSHARLQDSMAETQRAKAEVEQKNQELQRLASRDPLTGCFNRRAFFEAASEHFEQARQLHQPLCCVMSDIDHFKSFNDSYGHAVGDQVIQVVARTLAPASARTTCCAATVVRSSACCCRGWRRPRRWPWPSG